MEAVHSVGQLATPTWYGAPHNSQYNVLGGDLQSLRFASAPGTNAVTYTGSNLMAALGHSK